MGLVAVGLVDSYPIRSPDRVYRPGGPAEFPNVQAVRVILDGPPYI
jgi:hypothetical protein